MSRAAKIPTAAKPITAKRDTSPAAVTGLGPVHRAQAAAALTSLGYTAGEAAAALAKLDEALPVEELIKLALRGMARR